MGGASGGAGAERVVLLCRGGGEGRRGGAAPVSGRGRGENVVAEHRAHAVSD